MWVGAGLAASEKRSSMTHPSSAGASEPDPLIMTALFDPQSFDLLDGLRRRYFPAALNRVPAHATLFHHLPGGDLRAIVERLRMDCAATAPLPFTIGETRFLGRGVAFAIDCPGLVRLRAGFTAAWKDRLTAQDRQGYKPHATIQNKVSADAARDARLRLDALLPITGTVVGLALWHYRGGPWEEAGRFTFDAGAA